jgi:DNA-binding response OmpR family regulator
MAYILAVDDQPEVLGTLARALGREGHEIAQATSAQEAWQKIVNRRPDLVILDIMMPGTDGITLCRRLRSDSRFMDLLILFLTAKNETDDVVAGLDAGGDDYVTKPFELTELTARVRALLRRAVHDDTASILTLGDLTLVPETYQAQVGEATIQLTPTEYRLLRYLMEHANQPIAPYRLLEAVWDYPPNTGDPDLVRAHIRNLRAKVEPDSNEPRIIRTVHGVGYMIKGEMHKV